MYNQLLYENSNLKKIINNNNSNNNITQSNNSFNKENNDTNFALLSSELNSLQIINEKMKIDLKNLTEEKNNLEKEKFRIKSSIKSFKC